MSNSTIAKVFLNTTQQHSTKQLMFYKKSDQWIGLSGVDIYNTVKDITFALRSIGITGDSSVAILSQNSPRWAMADYGIICAGSKSVSIYPTLVSKQIEYIINNSESAAVFVENTEQFNKVKEIKDNCPTLKTIVQMDDNCISDVDGEFNFKKFLDMGTEYSNTSDKSFESYIDDTVEDDTVTLIYTSGTTGDPKGVMLTHKNIISNVQGTLGKVDINETDTLLSFLPLSHSFERMGGHFLAFSVGATVYYAESIETVPANLVETTPTVVLSVPRLYEKMYAKVLDNVKSAPKIRQNIFWWAQSIGEQIKLIRSSGAKISPCMNFKLKIADKLVFSKLKAKVGGKLRFFVSGGAPLSKDIGEFFDSAGVIILEGYGLTETSPVLTCNTVNERKFGTVGKVLDNVQVKIAKDGEILAKGDNIMKGYFKNDKATKEVVDSDGWFYSGDIGEFDEEGYLKITDRKKNLIVTSTGKNIAPANIENALFTSEYINQIIVLGDLKSYLTALIVPQFENVVRFLESKDISLSDNEAIVSHPEVKKLYESEILRLSDGFAKYEVVKRFELLTDEFSIEKGELTPTLKVIRRGVVKNYSENIERLYS
jgi:long-chain acyl-CoA synthetase